MRGKGIIYFDLDGCIARWLCVPVSETHKPGYFYGLEPEPELVKLVLYMHDRGFNVQICSKYYPGEYAMDDKIRWLRRVGLSEIPAVLVPYGENKSDYMEPGSVIVSDYSKELHECLEKGITAIKFYNSVNGNHGSWKGRPSINKDQSMMEMFRVLAPFLEGAGKEAV